MCQAQILCPCLDLFINVALLTTVTIAQDIDLTLLSMYYVYSYTNI